MKKPTVTIIVAKDKNGLIGNTSTNKVPWYLPKDLRHFKETTTGNVLVSGRKTNDSFGKPLPNRETVVVTRDRNYLPSWADWSIHVRHSLETAIEYAGEIAGERKIFAVGGGEIYKQLLSDETLLPMVEKIIVTEVDGQFEGDVFFPELDPLQWSEVSNETFEPDEKNQYPFTIKTYVPYRLDI